MTARLRIIILFFECSILSNALYILRMANFGREKKEGQCPLGAHAHWVRIILQKGTFYKR
eukprot:UN00796